MSIESRTRITAVADRSFRNTLQDSHVLQATIKNSYRLSLIHCNIVTSHTNCIQTLPTSLVRSYVTTSPYHYNRIRIHKHLSIVRKRTFKDLARFNFNHLANLAKWLRVRLRIKWFWVRIPLHPLKLQIHSKPGILHEKNTQSSFHHCYISKYVYLHTFHVNSLLKRQLSRGHRISCPSDHLERTDNKPFSGMIGPRHMTTSRADAHQSLVARSSLSVLQFGHSIYKQHYITIYLVFNFQRPSKQ